MPENAAFARDFVIGCIAVAASTSAGAFVFVSRPDRVALYVSLGLIEGALALAFVLLLVGVVVRGR